MINPLVLVTESSKDYELIDSGDGEKLERFGEVITRRPDPQALWRKTISIEEWDKADAVFTRDNKNGVWEFSKEIPLKWPIEFGGLKMMIRPTTFKHTGLFPEQLANWDWTRNIISQAINSGDKDIEILNLFGYTGGATLAVAEAGAKAVHIDGSKVAVNWAKENSVLSGLEDKPIRWLLDDAREFVKREIKRGRKYKGIIMDPPSFGHGPNDEMWQIEDHFTELVEMCFEILDSKPLFFLINGYSAGYSAISYKNNLENLIKKYGGEIEIGELTIKESKGGRLLPCGIFARWKSK